jgi:Tfp pilus assembly protein PilN
MINLLSVESQNYYRAARLNLKLRNYIFILLGVLLLVMGIFGAGYYLTAQERSVAEQELNRHQQETLSYQGVRNEAKSFADNLKIAKTILSQETLYSDLITKIAQTLPADAVLTSLILDETSFQKPIAFSARVKTKADALVLKSTLEASPLFQDVSLSNVTDESVIGGGGPTDNPIIRKFPVTVTFSAKIPKSIPGAATP